MSLKPSRSKRKVMGFPRVSGDEPEIIDQLNSSTLFSPRERG